MLAKAKQLISGNRAVSPVIGVILMVAVTVLLGAVVAGFTTGLGDDLNQNAPDAQIEFNYDNANDNLDVVHSGGDTLNPDNTQQLRFAGPNASDMSFFFSATQMTNDGNGNANVGGPIRAGQTIGNSADYQASDEIRLVWVGPAGDTSATLAEYEGPAA